MKEVLAPDEVAQVYRRLSRAMPGRTPGAKGPKGQPDAEVMAGLDVIGGPMRPSKTGGLPSLRGPEV